MIKTAISVSDAREVKALAELGADEFYCGMNHPGHVFALNRREMPHGNVDGMDEMRAIIESAHELGRPVHVTFNKTFYTGAELDHAVELIGPLEELGVDSLIVSDVGLLETLRSRGTAARIHLSSVAAAMNSRAIAFHRRFGVARAILPRMGLDDVRRIRREHPDIELEVLALGWFCPNLDGICSFQHDLIGFDDEAYDREMLNNACLLEYDIEMVNDGDARADATYAAGIEERYSNVLVRMSAACEACHVFDLADMGVDVVKIVGRLLNPAQKTGCMKFMRTVVDMTAEHKSKPAFARAVKALFKESFGFDCGANCFLTRGRKRK